ncbi:MAG: LLM class flavin-dependent oxidoreductase [Acidimicrobiia bacterium]|nr:LLM class flavin-dependent oxidoreductase [Acidimicrobiia bacterium]
MTTPRLDLDLVFGLTVAEDMTGYMDFARRAVELGYRRLWFPETYRLDPVSFAGWAAASFPGHPLGIGPVPAVLRTGPQLAMIAATLAGMGSTDLEAIVGASSRAMTEGWHNRGFLSVAAMESLLDAVHAACSGERTAIDAGRFRTSGFTNGLGPVHLPVGMASFGPKMLRLAGRRADRVALNMVSPKAVPAFLAEIDEGARAAGRPRPPVSIWAHLCLDPDEAAFDAGRRFVSGYVRVSGYDRNFAAQGFGAVVDAARAAPSTRDVRALIPDELLVEALGFGSLADIAARLDAYRELGVDVALVPNTSTDPGGVRTLAAIASLGG